MKHATMAVLLAGLWLIMAVVTQPLPHSYAQSLMPSRSNATLWSTVTDTVPPLGSLQPITGLLPSGTVSFTLSLTTTVQADCRWSETADTPYASMPHDFEVGQATVSHTTPISGVDDLADRRFYVRCQDVSPGRDPDSYQVQTHVRVLGPWSSNFPRVANLWNNFATNPGADFVAGFDLHVVFGGANLASQVAAIRAANPKAKRLLTVAATYGVAGVDLPATE